LSYYLRIQAKFMPQAHFFRMLVEPALDDLENLLLFPTCNPSLLAGRAIVLDEATLAGVGPVTVQDQPMFLAREVVGESFTGRTKRRLPAIRPLNEARHPIPRKSRGNNITRGVFTHGVIGATAFRPRCMPPSLARMGATHFLIKTLPRVATEMALHVLAYNLTRVMNIMGLGRLIAEMRT
jgi:hypothetical protein